MLEARYRTARALPLGRTEAPAGAGLLIRPAEAEARFSRACAVPARRRPVSPSTARSTPCRATRPGGSPASAPASG